jgi:hypothetical protein
MARANTLASTQTVSLHAIKLHKNVQSVANL